MLSKCTNPKCSHLFQYLHEGKLFRLDVTTGRMGAFEDYKEPGSRVEFFWLCDDCAADMTVVFTRAKGVEVKLFRGMRREAS